ncbi:MAG: 6-carboxytetrahydropterin synthase QueD [Syntrophomonadaceae bacterium]|jgi:6-pyruvoyltetrahydropterin/6-carboxytetrahydropterin synthase|nr:6-carboxytetrahydropterin synthase QueD [Syntrophomonadaceae bacterium]MDH7496922.1 6-carboxytetrahydropterin synthase QueD [Syntrophomonadaceae bacterium]
MFRIAVRANFAAAHYLRGHQGACAGIHGHTWEVEVVVRGRGLNELGMLMDFDELKQLLGARLQEYDHALLNEREAFASLNPTAENLARQLFAALAAEVRGRGAELERVTVWESPRAWASYQEDES